MDEKFIDNIELEPVSSVFCSSLNWTFQLNFPGCISALCSCTPAALPCAVVLGTLSESTSLALKELLPSVQLEVFGDFGFVTLIHLLSPRAPLEGCKAA